jgi:hypothetical protein
MARYERPEVGPNHRTSVRIRDQPFSNNGEVWKLTCAMTLFPPSSFDDRLETTVKVLYTQSKWTCSKNKVVSARHVLYSQRPR